MISGASEEPPPASGTPSIVHNKKRSIDYGCLTFSGKYCMFFRTITILKVLKIYTNEGDIDVWLPLEEYGKMESWSATKNSILLRIQCACFSFSQIYEKVVFSVHRERITRQTRMHYSSRLGFAYCNQIVPDREDIPYTPIQGCAGKLCGLSHGTHH